MSKSCVVVLVTYIALMWMAAPTYGQFLPGIPAVDAINASVQAGTVWPAPYSTVPRTSVQEMDLWGFGAETEFQLPVAENSRWEGTLGLGYNQLSLSAEFGAGRRLRGTLRDLPALSLYFGRATERGGAYGGITIAVSELFNGRLHRDPEPGMVDPGPIKIAASSFSAGVSIGYETGPFFIEAGYVGRYFPSLTYDGIPSSGFPADLGERMYAGGFIVRVGGTLTVRKSAPAKH